LGPALARTTDGSLSPKTVEKPDVPASQGPVRWIRLRAGLFVYRRDGMGELDACQH
jgi:hypothetical protein